MREKVDEFPIETLYFLETDDFLIHRQKFYFKKDKTIKLNSYGIGVSRLRVNNDKLLYLFNGLRGYYDVKTRYLKTPNLMEKKVPLVKKIYIYDYLIRKKYKYSNLFIYSVKKLNRPTIRLKKEDKKFLYYSFPYFLIEYLNKKREEKITKMNNKQYHHSIKDLRNLGFRFKLFYRKKYLGLRRMKILPVLAAGLREIFLTDYLSYINFLTKNQKKIIRSLDVKALKMKRKKRKIRSKFKKFYKTTEALKKTFLVVTRYLKKKLEINNEKYN